LITSGHYATSTQIPLFPNQYFTAASIPPSDNPDDWLINPTSQPFPVSTDAFSILDPRLGFRAENFLRDDSTFLDLSTFNTDAGEPLGLSHDGGLHPEASQGKCSHYAKLIVR
jgi:hypothetical protein